MKYIYPFLNPLEWIRARKFAKANAKYEKSSYDLELFLYSKILSNNMLHYGYFDDPDIAPDTISIAQFEQAQIKYAHQLMAQIKQNAGSILDVGCGMGGFSQMLHEAGHSVQSLTPNKNQIAFINETYAHLTTHHCKFEAYNEAEKFGTVINSESLQYIPLEEAFAKVNRIILPNGRWIVADYFNIDPANHKRKPHNLTSFYQIAKENGWEVSYEQDITPNILPTLTLVNLYVERFLIPLKHFAYEKLRFKKPKIYYLSSRLRSYVDGKVEKETRTVNPDNFKKERKYLLIVLDKVS